ncbi:MAG: N-acetylmuramoyl-L-alanine amidase, partial [SAR324 cluster bacterium]|nr:N-acetylmuramoyl-L-alanine amidase [SAR324 cluster bacterium]
VIDPGHGGRDPGAVGFGLREKDVALSLSRELKAVFQRERPDIEVSMTRDSDIFIPLDRRPVIAKQAGADLFVSIHLNAHDQERFHGVETYFLNLSTDASALRVAARENASTEKQITDLNAILRDLLQDTNILESSKLAKLLQASLITELRGQYKVRDLGVKQAPFMVLVGAEMPSVLVEAGFLTNRRENRRLKNSNYLRKIAEGIYAGLRKYIQEQHFALDYSRPAVAASGRGF